MIRQRINSRHPLLFKYGTPFYFITTVITVLWTVDDCLVPEGALRWLQCSPMARETWVQSQVKSYKDSKKWNLMPPYLTLSIIRYESRVKWINPGKGVAPSPTPWCSSYQKGSLWVVLDYSRQLYLLYLLWRVEVIDRHLMHLNREILTGLRIFFDRLCMNTDFCMAPHCKMTMCHTSIWWDFG